MTLTHSHTHSSPLWDQENMIPRVRFTCRGEGGIWKIKRGRGGAGLGAAGRNGKRSVFTVVVFS